MPHCVGDLISNGMDRAFWWKWEKHVLPLGTKISHLPVPQPVISPSFGEGCNNLQKPTIGDRQQSKDGRWTSLLHSLASFKWLPWGRLFWNNHLWGSPGRVAVHVTLWCAKALAAVIVQRTELFLAIQVFSHWQTKLVVFLFLSVLWVFMMTQRKFRSLENHPWACLVFAKRPSSPIRVCISIYNSTPKAPQSGIPFGWPYFTMRGFVLAVTVTGFEPFSWCQVHG